MVGSPWQSRNADAPQVTQEVGTALGAQAGEARLRDIVTGAGFKSMRRVAETPFNIVLEAQA